MSVVYKLIRMLGHALPVVTIAALAYWNAQHSPQPVIYDAAEYWRLSELFDWSDGWPCLQTDSARSFGYPFVIHTFCSLFPKKSQGEILPLVYIFQTMLLIGAILTLRWSLLPRSPWHDVGISLFLVALPVLTGYCHVLLTDLPALSLIQMGLVLSVISVTNARPSLRVVTAVASGVFLGAAVQIRPSYFMWTFAWLAFLVLIPTTISFLQKRWSAGLLTPLCSMVSLACLILLCAQPTVLQNQRFSHGYSLTPPVNQFMRYHLGLGLYLDRWSSNPPPVAEMAQAFQQAHRDGWQLRPHENVLPSWEECWQHYQQHKARAARQAFKHLYFAWHRTELYPYAGRPSPTFLYWMKRVNVAVLLLGGLGLVWALVGDHRLSVRLIAVGQLSLIAYFCVTLALVVPEERHTLAAYPGLFVFGGWALGRLSQLSRLGLAAGPAWDALSSCSARFLPRLARRLSWPRLK